MTGLKGQADRDSTGPGRAGRGGMILVNVLFIVALAAVVLLLMINSQTSAVDRTVRLREAAQASAFAHAAELSAVAALRRDATDAPQSDNLAEPWAAIQDRNVLIEGGTFSLSITDQQALFNLNTLSIGGLVAEDRLTKLLIVVGLKPELSGAILSYVRLVGPLSDLGQLSAAGLTPAAIAQLGEVATVLPRDTTINLNTADEKVLSVLFNSPVTARLLISARRGRGGVLTAQDLLMLNAFAPPGAGFTSNFYQTDAEVSVGDTRQRIISSLMRRDEAGRPEVIVYARRRIAAESMATSSQP